MKRLTTIACISALLLGAAMPAFAQDDELQRVVTYGDLDINHAQGADVLIARINQASRDVCGDTTARQTLQQLSPMNTCRSIAIEDAIAAVNNDYVYARYHGTGYIVIESEGDAYYDPYYSSTYVGPSVVVKKK